METIEKTTWTSRPALKKMIATTAGNIGKPQKIEKVDDVQKTFKKLFLNSGQNSKKFDCPQLKNDYAGIT